ncbi:hypothetical protein BLOT_015907 [Blomia tropicalis]|nr:hypothetical protein BLOT_015907 [Blomia tropicalis]
MTVALGLVGFWSFANIIIINQPKRMGVESPVHFGRLFGPYEPIHLGPKTFTHSLIPNCLIRFNDFSVCLSVFSVACSRNVLDWTINSFSSSF